MNIYDEWKFSLKKNYPYIFFIVLLVSLLTFLIYNLIFFGVGIKREQTNIEQKSDNKIMYNIFDNLTDPEDFSRYIYSMDGINRVRLFYNELNSMQDYQYQTIFTQPLFLKKFKGGRSFDGTPETPLKNNNYYEVKSIQLNENAYKFNDIKSTDYFKWDEVDYSKNIIPVLLGNDYKKLYKRGDDIYGDYYLAKGTKFKVIGFINKDEHIFYDNNITFLNSYIIIPYPEKLKKLENKNIKFESAVYFNMLRGIIITPNLVTTTDVIEKLNLIKNKTGFDKISIGGHSNLEISYQPLIKFIEKLKFQLIIYIIFIVILVCLINTILYFQILRSRYKNYNVYNMLGYDKNTIIILKGVDILTPLALSTVILINLITLIQFNFFIFLFSYLIMVCCCVFPFYFCLFLKGR